MSDLMNWYKIGDKPGLRSLREQMEGLVKLHQHISRSHVLDLGCAEGCLGKWMIESFGADSLHGIEIVPQRIDQAREMMAGYMDVTFEVGDLDKLDDIKLPREKFDIVLALAIFHKLQNPEAALKWAADLTTKFLVVRMPTIARASKFRHTGRLFDPCALLEKEFDLFSDDPGPRNELTLIFRRKENVPSA